MPIPAASKNMRFALVSLMLFLAGTSTAVAHAEERRPERAQPAKTIAESLSGQAQTDFVDGMALFNVGDHEGALTKLARAYEASREPRILFNIAACHEKLRRYVKARAYLRQYIAAGTAVGLVDDMKRQELEGYLHTYDRLIGSIEFRIEPSGVLVHIDENEIGTTPLPGTLEIEEGTHHVRLTKPGYRPSSTSILVQGGQVSRLTTTLEAVRHQGRLIIATTPKDAMIRVDGRQIGIGEIDRVLPSGPYHVALSARGRRTREFDVSLGDDDVRRFDVALEVESSSRTWLWVLGGAALMTAGVVTTAAILGTQHDRLTPPDASHGTVSIPLQGGF